MQSVRGSFEKCNLKEGIKTLFGVFRSPLAEGFHA